MNTKLFDTIYEFRSRRLGVGRRGRGRAVFAGARTAADWHPRWTSLCAPTTPSSASYNLPHDRKVLSLNGAQLKLTLTHSNKVHQKKTAVNTPGETHFPPYPRGGSFAFQKTRYQGPEPWRRRIPASSSIGTFPAYRISFSTTRYLILSRILCK